MMKENEYFNDSLYKNLKKFASFCIFRYNLLIEQACVPNQALFAITSREYV